ncbi:hypothetical protein ABBQ38_003208 [Trebouxia sp. C0009 RCD-2024]
MWPSVPQALHHHYVNLPSSALSLSLQTSSHPKASRLPHALLAVRLQANVVSWPRISQPSTQRTSARHQQRHRLTRPKATAGPSHGPSPKHLLTQPHGSNAFGNLQKAAKRQLRKLDGLWERFIPMVTLFFMMAFINTLLDSLANSLVITAVGGGTQVIPFLTVYGVLPISCIFLVLYSYATQRFSRATLFNIVVSVFLALYTGFALLYPHHEVMHLDGLATHMLGKYPTGFAGAIGMVRNWMFTLFYCTSELWGDVVLSLLFWGLANETTSLRDAPLLYPLFGVGANVAQTLAGRVLSAFSNTTADKVSYTRQVQGCMFMVLALGVGILALHHYINVRFPHNYGDSPKSASPVTQTLSSVTPSHSASLQHSMDSSTSGTPSSSTSATAGMSNGASDNGSSVSRATEHEASEGGRFQAVPAVSANSSSEASSSSTGSGGGSARQQQGGRSKLGFKQAVVFLAKSPQIRCLAMMALAQGLTTNLLDVAWKQHLHMLHPSPAAYSAFMGEVAMWTGLVTGTLMFVSPVLFDRLGWRGVAGATPTFMLWAGMPFFAGIVVYTLLPATATTTLGPAMLRSLVIVFAKGAKFSMFKPAEEMVYIGLDEESRTKGKAAIDVVGAQSGKSAGSVLQQVLLVASGGASLGRLPVMAVAFFFMLKSWLHSVRTLSQYSNCSMTHVEHTLDERGDHNNNEESSDGLHDQAVPSMR